MSFIRFIQNSIFRFNQRLLHTLVKPEIIGQDPQTLGVDTDKPIVYALQYRSYAERLVINKVSKELGWPDSRQTRIIENGKFITPFFSIYERGGNLFRKHNVAHISKHLIEWLEELKDNPDADIQIVPTRVFWGRAPDKEKSFFKVWLQNSGTIGGRLQTLLAVLFNGRQTLIRYSQPISLRQLVNEGIEQNKETEMVARKLSRVLRVHFRGVDATVCGPELSHRKTLVHQMPRKPLVLEAIEKEVENGVPKSKARAQALKYADEIAASMSHTTIGFFDIVLTWVWNKIYNGVEVQNIDQIQHIHKNNEIIYVPCHRSHIDYLLLSYVLFYNGLQLPHIAAGINLNMPIVGPILRRGGAFFMRRSFKGNPLYAAVFDEYLHSVFTQGYSTEYFVEGGRSRTGRTLDPKIGMLNMTLRSYLRDSRKPIIFMPVYVGYEKVFESSSYQSELKGKKKKKESFVGVLGTLKSMKNSFGKVHVTFGDPIYFTEFLNKHQPNWEAERKDNNFKPSWTYDVTQKLGEQIATHINNAASLNPINMVAIALLSSPRHAMDATLLEKQLEDYQRLFKLLPYDKQLKLPEGTAKDWITYAENMNMISRKSHSLGDIIQADEFEASSLSYYSNNVFHLFALPSLLSSFFLKNPSLSLEEIQGLAHKFYPFLKNELFLRWQQSDLQAVVDEWLEALVGLNYLHREGDVFIRPSANSNEYVKLAGLAHMAMQSTERYYLTAALLNKVGSGKVNATDLAEQASLLAQRISILHGINAPEFFDKGMYRVLVKLLTKHGLLTTDENDNLCFDKQLKSLNKELEKVLDASLRQSILQITWHDEETPEQEDEAAKKALKKQKKKEKKLKKAQEKAAKEKAEQETDEKEGE